HDARHPDARADPVHDEIARDLEEEVADEEDAGAEPVDGVAEPESLAHLERREADVDAVEVGDHIEQEHERDEPAAHLAEDGRGKRRVVGREGGRRDHRPDVPTMGRRVTRLPWRSNRRREPRGRASQPWRARGTTLVMDQILRVNMTDLTVKAEPFPAEWTLVGGRGLSAK